MAKAPGLTRLAVLAASLKDSDTKADGLASRLVEAVGGLNSEMGTTLSIVETIESARDALRDINKSVLPGDNGGPKTPLAGSVDSSAQADGAVSSHPSEVAQLGTTV